MSQRIAAIEHIRGLAMLGVIGIHTGAWSLSNPDVNIHLFALFEIVSRFSVPIFFFITAFGIFYQPDPRSERLTSIPFSRIRAVFIPYLSWSLLYMASYTFFYDDATIWQLPKLSEYLLFGLASYQLYFLVILLVFFLCLPLLWLLAIWLAARPVPRLAGLLILQILFNAYSSYSFKPTVNDYWLKLLIEYRLNYWLLHYLWIFMLGAVFALRHLQWQDELKHRQAAVRGCFWSSLALMLGSYYFVVLGLGFSLERAAFTIHQLSPMGVIYTGAAALYLSQILAKLQPPAVTQLLNILAKHSFFIYLVHPFVMSGLGEVVNNYQLVMTVPISLLFFSATVGISLTLSYAVQRLGQQFPAVSLLLTGKVPRQRAQE
ncbi:MAG: acyltransferase 3 [Anaerosporomusa subterranea]|jgi:surface polysaccharide O-acyltransferase-like enzyme|nr:acyltransferase 3 [Anaerosporomusa subterranea]